MTQIKDIKNKRFGRLIVLEFYELKNHRAYWKCKCDCGKVVIKQGTSLTIGNVQSCGCFQKERQIEANTKHGGTYERLYATYHHMIARCYNPKESQYKNYGGKGVTVYKEWLSNYVAFKKWAEENGYSNRLSIDRINSNGNYEPANCQWIPLSDNSKKKAEELRDKIGKILPAGVNNAESGRFLTYDKRAKYVGTFDSVTEAVEARESQNQQYVCIR